MLCSLPGDPTVDRLVSEAVDRVNIIDSGRRGFFVIEAVDARLAALVCFADSFSSLVRLLLSPAVELAGVVELDSPSCVLDPPRLLGEGEGDLDIAGEDQLRRAKLRIESETARVNPGPSDKLSVLV